MHTHNCLRDMLKPRKKGDESKSKHKAQRGHFSYHDFPLLTMCFGLLPLLRISCGKEFGKLAEEEKKDALGPRYS